MSSDLSATERVEYELLKERMAQVLPLLGDMLVDVAGQGGDLDGVAARMAELIELGAPVDRVRRHTALTNCCLKGNVRGVTLLLSKGADPNQQNGSTETPLHTLSNGGDPAIALLLVSAGARFDVVDSTGAGPIEAAEMAANEPLLSVLRSVAARNAAETVLSHLKQEPRP